MFFLFLQFTLIFCQDFSKNIVVGNIKKRDQIPLYQINRRFNNNLNYRKTKDIRDEGKDRREEENLYRNRDQIIFDRERNDVVIDKRGDDIFIDGNAGEKFDRKDEVTFNRKREDNILDRKRDEQHDRQRREEQDIWERTDDYIDRKADEIERQRYDPMDRKRDEIRDRRFEVRNGSNKLKLILLFAIYIYLI